MRTAATFKQADFERAVKAARASGLDIYRTEVAKDGRIILVHQPIASSDDLTPPAEMDGRNEWDDYLNEHAQK